MPKIKYNVGEVEGYDIPTMYEMSDEEYKEVLRGFDVILADPYDPLRCGCCGSPIATTLEQLNMLIAYLETRRPKMVPKRKDAPISVNDTDKPEA